MNSRGDELVADYLARIGQAGAGLPAARRSELIEDLREHIAAARAELSPETEAGVRTLLDRLGDPADIVAEASVGEPAEPPVAFSSALAPVAPPLSPQEARRPNRVLTIVLVVLGLLVVVPVLVCVVGLLAFQPIRSTGGPTPAQTECVLPQGGVASCE